MSILVTGINGFIGRRLSKFLDSRKKGIVLGYDGLIRDQETGDREHGNLDVTSPTYFRDYEDEKINFIIHLAAKTSIEDSIKNPYRTFFTNIAGTLNLLEFARKKRIKNFIFVSTYLYGKPKYLPIDESHPLMPHSPYNKSKFLAEKLCEYYSSEYGLNVVSLRPFYVYGPGNKKNSLVQKIITATNNGEAVILNGSRLRRDFLYIDDFVELIPKILANFPAKYNVYNVGYGVSHNLRDVAINIGRLMNKEIKIQCKRNKANEIMNMSADISKVSREFDWKPKINLDLGLKLIVQNLQE
jgi:UDP-glucose 4-epimerase